MRTCVFVLALAGCIADPDPSDTSVTQDGTVVEDARLPDVDAVPPGTREPADHRAQAVACDNMRDTTPADPQPGNAQCQVHADCTDGDNGRCTGNGHDGWYCTYDECFVDGDCEHVCACEGGFRSDFNHCIGGNCRTDADCGRGGFCSPSLGSCGHYDKADGYWCHTAEDECVDDTDCGTQPGDFGPYCAWSAELGHWACSNQECVGK